jgi:PqqD family protein of HPr-rel-A system
MKIKDSIAISESGFVFDSNSGDSYNLNPIGLSILKMLKSGKSENDIKTELMAEFDVDTEYLEKSIYDFMIKLTEFNLVEHEN